MQRKAFSLATLVAFLSSVVTAAPTSHVAPRDDARYVFAHFMVGIVEDYTIDDWKTDMNAAKALGIDAFALNNAKIDSYTPTQLANAYQAAQEVDFKVFPSFDFAYWSSADTDLIAEYMQNYSAHPAQMQYGGGAVASTFVGDSFDWMQVKSKVSNPIFAIPNLQDPAEATNMERLGQDGAFSWYGWATDGGNSIIQGPMDTRWDDRFVSETGNVGKKYMAPVSPWFSTHFNSKNWVFIAEQQPHDRWEQILKMKPDLVEIVTWNDYGESHYIGPWEPNHKDDGSSAWTASFPHDGWATIYAPYIQAYKTGADAPTVEDEALVYWYRPTPKDVTCISDPLPAPNGRDLLHDLVFVTTLLKEPGTLTVTSGGSSASVDVVAGIVTTNFTMGVGAQHFALARNGQQVLGGDGGLDIKDTCETYNYNAYVGQFKA